MQRIAITDRRLFSGNQPALLARCHALALAGIDFLLLREKDLPAGEQAALARQMRQAANGTRCRILIAGRPDIALACGLDGVHLSAGEGELTPDEVRHLFAGRAAAPFITCSCHTEAETVRARNAGADAALFAPVFGKVVDGDKVTPAAGLDALAAACHAAGTMPVFALGGITETNAPACVAAGAAGIAGIRTFFATGAHG